VGYSGNGTYKVSVSENEIDIQIQPDVKYLIELWDRNNRQRIPSTLLIGKESRTMKLHLEGWDAGRYTIYEIVEGKKIRKGTSRETQFHARPGHYRIVR
jgi:hypothetical protein